VISNGKSDRCNNTFTDVRFTSLLAKNIKEEYKLFLTVRISISLATLSEIFVQIRYFSSRVSTLTRDIDIAILSVCLSVRPSVRDVPVSDKNGLTNCHSFFHRTVAPSF